MWLGVHLTVVALGVFAVWQGIPWPLLPLVSLLVGLSFAGLAFVAHEALHGALTRRGRWARLVGLVGFWPFSLSPRLWIAWHNRVHHGHANEPGRDPDALASLDEYQESASVRTSTDVQAWSRGVLTLAFGFTVQSLGVLAGAVKKGILTPRVQRRAVLETCLAFTFWFLLGALFGIEVLVFCYLIPLVVGNAIVMMHIVTNHGLSGTVERDDPLASSLSVTVPRIFSWYTLDFGYHVEHHLLPSVSNRHARTVRARILELVPERYHAVPLRVALAAYFRQARLYLDSHTLLNPRTLRLLPTINGKATALQTAAPDPPAPSAESSGLGAVDGLAPPVSPQEKRQVPGVLGVSLH